MYGIFITVIVAVLFTFREPPAKRVCARIGLSPSEILLRLCLKASILPYSIGTFAKKNVISYYHLYELAYC